VIIEALVIAGVVAYGVLHLGHHRAKPAVSAASRSTGTRAPAAPTPRSRFPAASASGTKV